MKLGIVLFVVSQICQSEDSHLCFHHSHEPFSNRRRQQFSKDAERKSRHVFGPPRTGYNLMTTALTGVIRDDDVLTGHRTNFWTIMPACRSLMSSLQRNRRLMEEIVHHLGCSKQVSKACKYCKWRDMFHVRCRISSINGTGRFLSNWIFFAGGNMNMMPPWHIGVLWLVSLVLLVFVFMAQTVAMRNRWAVDWLLWKWWKYVILPRFVFASILNWKTLDKRFLYIGC